MGAFEMVAPGMPTLTTSVTDITVNLIGDGYEVRRSGDPYGVFTPFMSGSGRTFDIALSTSQPFYYKYKVFGTVNGVAVDKLRYFGNFPFSIVLGSS